MNQTELELKMEQLIFMAGEDDYEKEYMFHHTRKWRFDFAFVKEKVAVEVQGGIYTKGAHVRGRGYEKDREKTNEASLMGWIVIEVTPKHIKNGQAIGWVIDILKERRK